MKTNYFAAMNYNLKICNLTVSFYAATVETNMFGDSVKLK